MDNRFEGTPRCRVGEDNGCHRAAIDRAISRENSGAESLGNGASPLGASPRDAVRQFIGIETRHTKPPELIEDITLPRRDAPGQSDSLHIKQVGLVGLPYPACLSSRS